MSKRPYPNNREVEEIDGIKVITPVGHKTRVPLSCPCCGVVLRSKDDESSFLEFECCEICALHWARPHFCEWKKGWRPTKTDAQRILNERGVMSVLFDG